METKVIKNFACAATDLVLKPVKEFEVHTRRNLDGTWVGATYTAVKEDGQPIGVVFEMASISDSIGKLVNARNCNCDACKGYPSAFDNILLISSKSF